MNIAKILRTLILKNICKRLLLLLLKISSNLEGSSCPGSNAFAAYLQELEEIKFLIEIEKCKIIEVFQLRAKMQTY